jgi:hypothetical protein
MAEFLLLMHDDTVRALQGWDEYFAMLRARGVFDGGSSIGAGVTLRKEGDPAPLSPGIAGYIRVRAADLAAAQALVAGNPVHEAGGTIEIRALPRD